MAEIPSSKLPFIQAADEKLLRETYNLQLEIEKSQQRQNNSLLEQYGLRKDISTSILEALRRTDELNKKIDKLKQEELQMTRELATIEDETKRAEVKQIIESKVQRRAAYTAELEMLSMVQRRGWLPILYIITRAFNLFNAMDQSAARFRLELGMMREPATHLRKMAQETAIDYMHVGVTIDGAYASIKALGKEMGSVHIVSQDLVKTTALLKAQLGVSEEASAGFMRNMAAISNSLMQSQINSVYMAGALAQAAGVPLNVIMNDVGKASGNTLTMMSRIPNQVLRSAIELRKMGTSLKDASNSSRDILNFTDSVNAAMEASVLIGRSINLQKARELAYHRDIVGSTREILRIANKIDFRNLDVFQQEAFARASGKSVDELLHMIQAQKQWDAARRSADPHIRAQVKAYEELKRANEETLAAQGKSLELMIQQQSNQARMTSISQKWNQLISKVAYIFLPFIDKTLGFVLDHFDAVVGTVATISLFGHRIGNAFMSVGKILGKISNFKGFSWLDKVGNWVYRIGGSFNSWGKYIKNFMTIFKLDKFLYFNKLGDSILKIFSKLIGFGGRFSGFFGGALKLAGRFLIPLDFAWNIFKQIRNLLHDPALMGTKGFFAFNGKLFLRAIGAIIHALWNTLNDLAFGLPNLLAKGIGAVGNAIFGSLLSPFKKAWGWLDKWFFGHSPSQLGLSIVTGLMSVGGMIFDSLTSPFRKGLAWIADKIPGMSKIAAKLHGVGHGAHKSMEAKMAASYVPAATITPEGTVIPAATKETKAFVAPQQKEEKNNDKTLVDILNAINQLNANLESGKIGIYLDGQLVSATIARQTAFRGGYGVNKV